MRRRGEDCEDDPGTLASRPVTISWDAVTASHPTLGPSAPVAIAGYQVVVEREEPVPLKFQVDLDPATTQLILPDGLLAAGDEMKVEVLVIEANGNQVARESCFVSGG